MAVNVPQEYSLKTKRLVIGQIAICRGCCCGNTENGRPEVPVEWLKNEWRKRGLLKRVQLTHQRLCRAMRRAECSCHYYLSRHGMVRKYRQNRPIS